MTTEIQEASKRLRRYESGEDLVEIYGTHEPPRMRRGRWGNSERRSHALSLVDCDRENLADAHLALFPPDDETPITEDMMPGFGFAKNYAGMWLISLKRVSGPMLIVRFDGKSAYRVEIGRSTIWAGQSYSCGQLRRLCAALEIE